MGRALNPSGFAETCFYPSAYLESVNGAGLAAFGSASTALVASLAMPAVGRSWGWMRDTMVNLVAFALGVLAIAMLGLAFTDDDYLNDGRSVWDVSDGSRRLLLMAAVLLAAVGAVLAGLARRRRSLMFWVPFTTMVVVFVDYIAIGSTLE